MMMSSQCLSAISAPHQQATMLSWSDIPPAGRRYYSEYYARFPTQRDINFQWVSTTPSNPFMSTTRRAAPSADKPEVVLRPCNIGKPFFVPPHHHPARNVYMPKKPNNYITELVDAMKS